MIYQQTLQRNSIVLQPLTTLNSPDSEAPIESTVLCVPGVCRKGAADGMQLGQAVSD